MMRSANPALNPQTFTRFPSTVVGTEKMTIRGTVNKTSFLLLIVVAAAAWSWNQSLVSSAEGWQAEAVFRPGPWVWIGAIGGFIMALITIFKKHLSPYTSPAYALLEGLFLGAVSAGFEVRFPGIVMQAILGTFGTLFALLAAYRSGLIRATENFKLGLVAATGGICLVYLVTFVLGFFGTTIPYIHDSGAIGIGFSVFVVVIAALNLVMDFDFIESGEAAGAPKYMEWYAAFGLLVTLIWLYLEILRLLSKVRSRR